MPGKIYSKNSLPLPKEDLKFVSYCPLCRHNFNSLEARILEQAGDNHLLHIICSRCFSSILVLVLASDLGISSFGLVTDLTGDDVIKFKNQLSVSEDDVIFLHSLLKNNDYLLSW
jgi:hypothetical protein